MHPVDVSIVIVAYQAKSTIAACLESLRRQTSSLTREIILVNSSADGTEELVRDRFPEVRLWQVAERKFPGDARNLALERALGGIIAFIDADCEAEPDWLENLFAAHRDHPHLGIGGAIGNRAERLAGWASFFCEFSQWLPGLPDCQTHDIAAASMTYKRETFDRFGGFAGGVYCSDTLFHQRLARNGHALLFTSRFAIRHQSIDDVRKYLRHEFFHGRSFGSMRVADLAFPRWKQIAFLPASPWVVGKLLGGISKHVARSRYHPGKFVACLPLLALGVAAWVLGETKAYARNTAPLKSR